MTETRRFDEAAATWDETPRRVELAREVAAAIRRAVPLGEVATAMDFGCGTGLVTLELQPHVGRILGLDTSEGMLEVLRAKAKGLENLEVRHLDPPDAPLGGPFHLIASSMTLHHVEAPPPLLRRIREALHPGGWLALADLEAEDGSFHDDPAGVHHHGFAREHLRALLEEAGFAQVRLETAATVHKQGRAYPVLLATARKPA